LSSTSQTQIIAGMIGNIFDMPREDVVVPSSGQQGTSASFDRTEKIETAFQDLQAAREQQSANSAAQGSFENHPANETASALRVWQVTFAGNHSGALGTAPDWGSLPVNLHGSYSGSALAIMPNGSSLTGSMSMDLQLQMAPTYQYHSMSGNVDFGQAGQVPLSGTFVSGVQVPTFSAFSGAQAFGGSLVNSSLVGAFHGSQAEVFAGNWSATIGNGPNAGVVNGHLGGAAQ
jgi:hypothetical protein